MSPLKITLAADGASDKMLLSVIDWITSSYNDVAFNRVAFICLAGKPLPVRIDVALKKEPCDILIIHRDAENESYETRRSEITHAFSSNVQQPSCVCLVPIKMTEAWFLHSSSAIHLAVGRGTKQVDLNLPKIREVESCDAKTTLEIALKKAGEFTGRRLRNFNFHECRHNVARYIEDFSTLRSLESFRNFEDELRSAIVNQISND